MDGFRRVQCIVLLCLPLARAAPPARGVAQFESSAFCKKYRCALSGPIEPLQVGAVVQEYFYNYRVYLPDKTLHPGQFGMRLDTEGARVDPFLIVRWVPVKDFLAKDVVGINDLVGEITAHPEFDAAAFVLRFEREWSAHPKLGYGEPVPVGAYTVRCSYTPGKATQVTLLIETRPSIGSATMTPDGTIVLTLRAQGAGGTIGDGRFTYPKGHKEYDAVLKHLGGLKPGESKLVPPWP